MKNNFYGLLLAGSIALLTTACKKSKDDGKHPEPGTPRLKTATYSSGGSTIQYELTYDSQGRLTTEKLNGKLFLQLVYNGSTITWTQYNSGSLVDSSIITLDGSGLATSRKSWAANGAVTTAAYQYNNGYLFKATVTAGSATSTTTYYRYAGNLDSTLSSDGDRHVYEYYTDKKATLENENNGLGFLGKGNSHPVRKETYKSGNTTSSVTYGYEYDTQGRISKRINSNGALLSEITYY